MAKQNQKKQTRKNRNLPLILAAALVVLLAAGISLLNRPKPAAVEGSGALVIPLSGITEEASFYPVTVDGTEMEVLAIRTADGDVRTAFNTCQSCYTSGHGYYVAQGTELICQNCGFHFTAEEVGLETGGGCNPGPIPAEGRTETGENIEISYETLVGAKDIFARWSKG